MRGVSNRGRALLAAGALVVGVVALVVAWNALGDQGLDGYSVVVVPHPDDEMQAWSLVEAEPDLHHVFVVLTRGEQTTFCSGSGYDPATGELPPDPDPVDRFTDTCVEARIDSLIGFMDVMWSAERGAGAFEPEGTLAGTGGPACRVDDLDATAPCTTEPTTADVWSTAGASIVVFDLGDGDLTTGEVEWALRTVIAEPAAAGVGDELPLRSVIGAGYYNDGDPACFDYPHPDHGAVHDVLRAADWLEVPRLTAVCDGDVERRAVSLQAWDLAFSEDSDELGAHILHYGWLLSADPGFYRGDYDRRDELFHREQEFWSSAR